MILTNSCKAAFLKSNSLSVQLLSEPLKNLAIYRWFNMETNIGIDIQNWEGDGFDYNVSDPYVDKVYTSKNVAGNRNKNFDEVLKEALKKANSIYNGLVY